MPRSPGLDANPGSRAERAYACYSWTVDPLEEAVEPIMRDQWRGQRCLTRSDQLVREEPLEIRVAGAPIAVVMRTPGHDIELVRGFLLSEGIVQTVDQLQAIRHCSEGEAADNVVQVVLSPGVAFDLAQFRRSMFAASSCGICGKASIEAAMTGIDRLPPTPEDSIRLSPEQIYALPDALRAAQVVFGSTGALHAAALVDQVGKIAGCHEDVGRHNAVDKVIGWAQTAEARAPQLRGGTLLVSGRVSFEIVQKAARVGIGSLVAISAPSSLAVEFARQSGMTIVAFVRGHSMSVYCGAERILTPSDPGAVNVESGAGSVLDADGQ